LAMQGAARSRNRRLLLSAVPLCLASPAFTVCGLCWERPASGFKVYNVTEVLRVCWKPGDTRWWLILPLTVFLYIRGAGS